MESADSESAPEHLPPTAESTEFFENFDVGFWKSAGQTRCFTESVKLYERDR